MLGQRSQQIRSCQMRHADGFDWNTDNVEKLKGMHADGLSFTRIGIELGISRNAAIGKAARIGLPGRNKKPVKPIPRRPKGHRPQKLEKWNPSVRLPDVDLELDPALDDAPTLIGEGIQLQDLTEHHCRCPYGQGPFVFCGRPVVSGLSYCAGHARMVYQRAPERKKSE